jgi:LmbE family N-acetylglucosaminyl deacetylase
MDREKTRSVAIIVAHPDDETLWVGGTILSNPFWKCFVVSLCRKNDTDRSRRFIEALKIYHAEGIMGDLDDGPDQNPLDTKEIELEILNLLPSEKFDLIITHNQSGEYTKHLRHEEISLAVLNLWQTGQLKANELWTFAYEDGNKKYFPLAVQSASIYTMLPRTIWQDKYKLITETYGFKRDSWEAKTTPSAEAFWKFTDPTEIKKRINNKGAIL